MPRGDDVLAAAIRHLNADPTASMAAIAAAIGISRATLHRHYATREALLHALGDRAIARWAESMDSAGIDAAAASGDPARLAAALDALLRAYVVDADEHGFALTDHFVAHLPDLVERGEALEEREIAFYAACRRAGVLRADLPARWMSNAVYGLMVAVRDSLRHGDVARRDVADLLVGTLLHGAGGPAREGGRP
ncbi:TetR/AcrR family transcriptional regulator [Actinomadura parmotrematis]|uniref:TetR family transcriptional regulator n=1 Tax=Actinomadura parmotrematis TaxID=2864039 RepID=A0ABS7FPW4_9ACTN|nr:TetR family transcriptional regulator [Actinomadura parmotrematis]MBW8481598.1 TetR family transcriptional regulator [Actinomadura parmotrematis]